LELERLSKSKSRTQTLHRRSWKWWLWHYNGFYVKAFLWLKRLWCKKSYVLCSRFGLLNLTVMLLIFWGYNVCIAFPNLLRNKNLYVLYILSLLWELKNNSNERGA